MSDKYGNIIIIKKKKKGKHPHHGGAWKIAYADFVTAMMAFFLLLWLISSLSDKELASIAQYFTPTTGLFGEMGIGFRGGQELDIEGTRNENIASPSLVLGAPTKGAVVDMPKSSDTKKDLDLQNFTSLERDLYKAIHENPELKQFTENILIEQTPEGLRIQILENQNKRMFIANSYELMPYIKIILYHIGSLIKLMPNYISIDGHSISKEAKDFDLWVLSSLRAESVRRFLTDDLIDQAQILRIVGKGDMDPLDRENLNADKNIRVSIILLKNSIVPYQKKAMPENI
jgi:chemotaxis protein MotB